MPSEQNRPEVVAQLGDASPLKYGGYWVFREETGEFSAEQLVVENEDEDPEDDELEYRVYRFTLQPCTYDNGVLSDNPYHPAQAAWFARSKQSLQRMASFSGVDLHEFVADLCATDPVRLAVAYRTVGSYYGWENLDSYPLELSREEALQRYAELPPC